MQRKVIRIGIQSCIPDISGIARHASPSGGSGQVEHVSLEDAFPCGAGLPIWSNRTTFSCILDPQPHASGITLRPAVRLSPSSSRPPLRRHTGRAHSRGLRPSVHGALSADSAWHGRVASRAHATGSGEACLRLLAACAAMHLQWAVAIGYVCHTARVQAVHHVQYADVR